jgi:histidine triad (HIT) family protein
MPHDACLFCRIIAREIPAKVVAETDDALALRDVNPQTPVHVLVIPKKHVRHLTDAAEEPDLVGRLMAFAVKIARDEGIADSGYRVVANTNLDGGQSVYHLHLHLLGGRVMTWPPG